MESPKKLIALLKDYSYGGVNCPQIKQLKSFVILTISTTKSDLK